MQIVTLIGLIGLIAALLAAALHILIFWMESIAWEGPLARKTFGGTPAEARPHAFYAYNQGFYNLFLAIEAILGVVLRVAGGPESGFQAGTALVLFGTGSMLAAALVLALKSPAHRGAALKQGFLPMVAIVCLALGVILG